MGRRDIGVLRLSVATPRRGGRGSRRAAVRGDFDGVRPEDAGPSVTPRYVQTLNILSEVPRRPVRSGDEGVRRLTADDLLIERPFRRRARPEIVVHAGGRGTIGRPADVVDPVEAGLASQRAPHCRRPACISGAEDRKAHDGVRQGVMARRYAPSRLTTGRHSLDSRGPQGEMETGVSRWIR